MNSDFGIVTLKYVSIYAKDLTQAIDFYSRVFGEPKVRDEKGSITGWPLGDTWLTLFPAKGGTDPERNPCNVEFAIKVSTDEQVDKLFEAFIAAGAKSAWKPEDTEMYEPMRFASIDDPFGVRIDMYCSHEKNQ